MAKVPKVLGEEGVPKFRDTYVNSQNGQEYPCYRFPKREACLMAMSYSYELQAKVFDKMTELEQRVSGVIAMPDFTNPAAAARAWADQVEARQIAEQTKHLIGSRREATAMNSATLARATARNNANKVDVVVARNTVKALFARWRNAPNTSVVATAADLPAVVLEELAQQGEETARGVFHRGTF